jgi:hypothetical protein
MNFSGIILGLIILLLICKTCILEVIKKEVFLIMVSKMKKITKKQFLKNIKEMVLLQHTLKIFAKKFALI